MRLINARIRGFGVLTDFALDLGDYECGEIVQLSGVNGAGKTSALELAIPGAIYRECPTRGSLRDLARARDSNLDVWLSHGGTMYHITHVVDAVSGKSEAIVCGADGVPLYDTTKIRDFDEWSARTFISQEVLLACTFGSQASGGFLSAKPTERKAILLRSLGLEAWEARAAAAAERAKAAETGLTRARAKLDALGLDDPEAETRHAAAQTSLQTHREQVESSRRALSELELTLSQTREGHKRKQELGAERARLEADIVAAETQSERIRKDIEDLRATLVFADAIRGASARLIVLDAELNQLREARATAVATLQGITRELAAIPPPVADVNQRRLDDARQQLDDLERQRVDKSIELDKLCEKHAVAVELLGLHAADLATFRGRYESLSATRIAGLRSGLTRIVNSESKNDRSFVSVALIASGLPAMAELALQADDALVSDVTDEELARLTKERDEASAESDWLRDARNSTELALEQLKLRLDEATHRTGRLAAEFASDKERRAEFTRREMELNSEQAKLEAELTQHGERITVLSAESAELKPLAAKLFVLDRATATLVSLESSLATEQGRDSVARARLADIDFAITVPILRPIESVQAQVNAARADLQRNEEAHRVALEVYTEAKLAWTRQQETAVERVDRTSQVASLELELSDWTRLKDDLGKNGIQAAEIDSALDELNVLVNDLLHECHSSRWTVRIDTQRLSGDGKRMIETLDVVILDTETGREGKAETFSGGERAILGEALALALTMVACKRAGLERPTLVRDESGAALDPANARAYIAMLRRAAKYVEASCVLVVSHQPDIAELCDAKIEVTR